MKKNIFLRIAALMLVVTFATSGVFMGSGTTAKYVAAATGGASARVAKFEVWVKGKVKGADTTEKNIAVASMDYGDIGTFDLYDTLRESKLPGTVENTNQKPGTDGTTNDVHSTLSASSSADKIIAPGTSGFFQLTVRNGSEVKIKVTFDTDSDASSTDAVKNAASGKADLRYYASTTAAAPASEAAFTHSSITSALSSISLVLDPIGGVTTTTSGTIYIWWCWRFEVGTATNGIYTNDSTDTALGVAAATAGATALPIGCAIKMQAVQVD